MKKQLSRNEHGSIILVFIITLPVLILMALYYTNLALTSFQVGRQDQLHTEAQLAADAGADYGVEQLSQNNNWTGTGSEVTLHSDSKLHTTFTDSVSGDSNSKTIAVTGRTYWPASSTTATRSVSIDVNLYPVTSGNFSIVTGAGGLIMSNSSKIVSGNVFINGQISMSNSAQIGLSTNPVNVQVADQACPNPADATYPRVCNSGENGQPIAISSPAHIYGTVTATNQTNGSNMSNTGLVANGSVSPLTLPTYDRAAQKTAATNNMTAAAASCSGNQTVTWPANTKITGNVTVSNSKCTVIIQGNVWITGSLSVSNGAQLDISNSVGTTLPNIMVDGSGGITFSQSSAVVRNSSNTGAEFYTFYSKASCSPDCSSVTGTDLASSRTVTTISLNNSASAASSVFYAYWSQVSLGNSGQIGAVIGQTIQMSNTAAITFGSSTGVAGNTVWVIKGYHRQ
jgi:hypothetical protein